MENINMVDLKTQYLQIEKEIDHAIKEVIKTATFINGPSVTEFKKNLESYLEVPHVIPCGNGTDAIQVALMALGLQPGDEVITTTFSFIATAEVIALLKLKPVFVDVDLNNFNILPSEIEKAITPKTKAIIPVHLYGQCAPMEAILEIANKHSLYIIEDTAQAIGAKYFFKDGSYKFAGTIGTIGTTSFFPSKNLGCYGDGGAIFTRNEKIAERLKMICNHGSKRKYDHEIIGVNSRLDSIQAAILNIKLAKLNEYSCLRIEAAKEYSKGLAGIPWIETPNIENYTDHVFHQYTIKITNGKRDELKAYLEANNIPSMVYYPKPLHKQKAFSYLSSGNFPNTDKLESKVLSLPIHTELNNETIQYIVDKIKSF